MESIKTKELENVEHIREVELIINNVMKNKKIRNILINLNEFDNYTFTHSINVGILSVLIGNKLKLNKLELYNLGVAALLHDVGKMFIGNDIINKPSKLTNEEFEIIKKHPKLGCCYLEKYIDLDKSSYIGILEHHEKYDGTGYPSKLAGNEISLFGRIISIADVYDALISERPYRQKIEHSEVIKFTKSNANKHFDPKIVEVFVKNNFLIYGEYNLNLNINNNLIY